MPAFPHDPSQPLVSIVIPTHERPELLALSLSSAQAQSYKNIEIIISDNSVKTDARSVLAAQIESDPRVSYHKQVGGGPLDNWLNALSRARGEYVNFLMDDDLFHPQKIERMLHYFTHFGQIGLVTSYRQLIDEQGKELPQLPGTEKMFETDTFIEGNKLAEYILKRGSNLIGEPTTAMIRRADIGDTFGRFCDKQYMVLSDLATWMEQLHGRHCVYISDALSSFRIHQGQDQRSKSTALNANMEWLRLLCDGHKHGKYILDEDEFRRLLSTKLSVYLPYLTGQYEELREGQYNIRALRELIDQALQMLFGDGKKSD